MEEEAPLQITEVSGALAGARGATPLEGPVSTPATTAPENLDIYDVRDLEQAAEAAGMRFAEVTAQLAKQGYAKVQDLPKEKLGAVMTWIGRPRK